MDNFGRREALQALGVLALVPVLGVPEPLGASPGRPASGSIVEPPAGEFLLARDLRRGLSDGGLIRVQRAWRCRFSAALGGLAVQGEQVSVRVDAPPKLAPIAEIERKREVQGLFPAMLGASGRIASANIGTSQQDLQRAIDEGLRILVARGVDAGRKADARRFLADLSNAGAQLVTQVPADLFFPAPGARRESREIVLPDGGTGLFELATNIDVHAGSGLLKSISRTVTTRAGHSVQQSSEDWFLRRL